MFMFMFMFMFRGMLMFILKPDNDNYNDNYNENAWVLHRELHGYDQRTAAERHEWLVKATTQQHHAKRRLEQLFNSS